MVFPSLPCARVPRVIVTVAISTHFSLGTKLYRKCEYEAFIFLADAVVLLESHFGMRKYTVGLFLEADLESVSSALY